MLHSVPPSIPPYLPLSFPLRVIYMEKVPGSETLTVVQLAEDRQLIDFDSGGSTWEDE